MAEPTEETGDKPLDPAIERVRARLRTMMLVAAGTLGLGLVAVVFAIVYRVSHLDAERAPADAPWQSMIELESRGSVVSTALDGDRIVLVVDGPDGRFVEVHHLKSGRLIGRAVLIAK